MSLSAGIPSHDVRARAVRARFWANWLPTVVVWVVLVITGLPLLWMISTAFKSGDQVLQVPPSLIPHPFVWSNFGTVLSSVPWLTYMRNSLLVSTLVMLGTGLSGSLAAYALAWLRAPGRDILFFVTLATIMLPTQVTLVPLFIVYKQLGWLDTLLPLFVPAFFGGGAFYIFLMRQFFMGLSSELFDAAKVDGCGYLTVWFRILLPLSKPVLATVMLFAFLASWNDFLGPEIFLNSDSNFTLAIGLQRFLASSQTQGLTIIPWQLVMAASLMMVFPCIVLFCFVQRYLVQGIVVTGIKG